MTIHTTPVYSLQYADTDTALADYPAVTQNVATSVEAALLRGAVAPPNASDLATLSGRVTTNENRLTKLEAGHLLRRTMKSTANMGPISATRTLVTWETGQSQSFTLTEQHRVEFRVRGKGLTTPVPGIGRMFVICAAAPATLSASNDAQVMGAYDHVTFAGSYSSSFEWSCDALLAAGTYTMGLVMQAPVAGQSFTLYYDPNPGPGTTGQPYTATVLTARILGSS